MTSEATDDPPGLSTRSTTALIDGSSFASWMYSTSVSDPAYVPSGPSPLRPELIVPTA